MRETITTHLPLAIGLLSLGAAFAAGVYIVVVRAQTVGVFARMTRDERRRLRIPIVVYWVAWSAAVVLLVWWLARHVLE